MWRSCLTAGNGLYLNEGRCFLLSGRDMLLKVLMKALNKHFMRTFPQYSNVSVANDFSWIFGKLVLKLSIIIVK